MKKVEKFIESVNLDAFLFDNIYENVDYEILMKFSEYFLILPNINEVLQELKKSKIIKKGKNWLLIKIDEKCEEEQNNLFYKYCPCTGHFININDYK